MPVEIRSNVPLAKFTTMQVGGPARFFCSCAADDQLQECLLWARKRDLPIFILGGGSNLLVSDSGFAGLVVYLAPKPMRRMDEDATVVKVPAYVNWDNFVHQAVENGLSGVECLSGIPGLVGGTPIQNVGAYGQEVANTIEHVWVCRLATGDVARLSAAECGFGQRTSHFKEGWQNQFVVIAVSFRLRRECVGPINYPELAQHLAKRRIIDPTPRVLRATVMEIRRAKSMVLDPNDPNHRSAGSFFTNPVLTQERALVVGQMVRRYGIKGRDTQTLSLAGLVQIPAAWLIEEAGFERGFQLGNAGLSTRHALALINRGGACAFDLLRLAALIRKTVRQKFNILLCPEPKFLGFAKDADELFDSLSEQCA